MRDPAPDILAIPPDRLGDGTPVAVSVVATDVDVVHAMRDEIVERVQACRDEGRPACFIVPVGPVGQYERLARLCNRRRLSLRDVTFVAMDEYLRDPHGWIDASSPLSFRRHLQEHFYDLLDGALAPRPENRIVPDPADPGAVARAIERAGGVDTCLAGVGITGHLAFNDPPPPGTSEEAFAALGTRVVELAPATRVINAVTAAGGDLDAIPRHAVTVGMREILGARRVRVYMNRPWQNAIVRRWLHGPVTAMVPASLLRRHGDVHLTITEEAARPPAGRLR